MFLFKYDKCRELFRCSDSGYTITPEILVRSGQTCRKNSIIHLSCLKFVRTKSWHEYKCSAECDSMISLWSIVWNIFIWVSSSMNLSKQKKNMRVIWIIVFFMQTGMFKLSTQKMIHSKSNMKHNFVIEKQQKFTWIHIN